MSPLVLRPVSQISKHDQLPEDEADALFDYMYETAGIFQEGGGIIFMGPLHNVTPFELPDNIPDEIVQEAKRTSVVLPF